MEKEEKILIKYVQADFCQRMHMFLQYRDLREDFQEIDRTYLAPQMECKPSLEKHHKEKCFRDLSLPTVAYSGIAETRALKNLLSSLKGLKPHRGIP